MPSRGSFILHSALKIEKLGSEILVFGFLYLLFLWVDENMVVHNYEEISGST
jgi:hypothetical protein